MPLLPKLKKDTLTLSANAIGNLNSINVQNATDTMIDGMNSFIKAAGEKINVPFAQSKGNLFEYIEAAKFNRNAAMNGNDYRAVITDSVGRPHDPADIEIVRNGKVLREVQAKFSDSQHAAADSVSMQRKDKYQGMQRLIRKENEYYDSSTGEKTTLLNKARTLAKKRADVEGGIYQEQYKDVYDNLTDELNYDGISSGGTTLEELRIAHNSPANYANSEIKKQIKTEQSITAKNMASANMVTTGIAFGIENALCIFNGDKEACEAIKDVGTAVVKSGVKGYATGVLSTKIRYEAIKNGSQLLSDSAAATVMAGGLIDSGVSIYSYARGEIPAEQLRDELVDTAIKSFATVFYSKAVPAMAGVSVAPIVPIAVYTSVSFVVTATREILRNAKLNTEENQRISALLEESIILLEESYNQFVCYVEQCEKKQKQMFESFINDFQYNIETGENYDSALMAIVKFANQAGIVLNHINFNDFKNAMKSNEVFRLG